MPSRVRKNGRLLRLKRPDSAKLARPKKVHITHGAGSRALLKDPLDLRTVVGKAYHGQRSALRAHLGGTPTVPQEKLIDQASRLCVLADIAWGELMRVGRILQGEGLHPAFDAYIKATRDARAVLVTLGLKPHTREVPDLNTYLNQRPTEESTDAP
jgi:hypothetical protein